MSQTTAIILALFTSILFGLACGIVLTPVSFMLSFFTSIVGGFAIGYYGPDLLIKYSNKLIEVTSRK